MSNDLIFTLDKVSEWIEDGVAIQQTLVVPEKNKIFLVLNNGLIMSLFQDSIKLIPEAILHADIFEKNLRLINFTFIRSPFNVFQQNGKWSLVGLYEDGRMRFWDVQNLKCYLLSKYRFFKQPHLIEKMGSLLENKKRFIYMIRREQDKNQIIFFDVWNQKKFYLQIDHNYQMVDCFSYKNILYILDVDQKIVIVDCNFLAEESFLNYEEISIKENVIQKFKDKLKENIRAFMLPVRTVEIRFDSILTNADYDLKNYQHFIIGRNNILVAFSKEYCIVLDYIQFTKSKYPLNFETYKDYIKEEPVIQCSFGFSIKNFFKVRFHDEWNIFLMAEDGSIYYFSESFLIMTWKFLDSPQDSYQGMYKILNQRQKLVQLQIKLPLLFQNSQIESVTISQRRVNFFQYQGDYWCMEYQQLINLQKQLLSIGSLQEYKYVHEIVKEKIFHRKETNFEQIYEVFTDSFKKIYPFQQFNDDFSKLIILGDEIKEDFVCNFRNNKNSFYLFAFESGKIIVIPLFIPTFVNYTDFEIYFLDTQITNWENIFFKNDSLIITDSNYFYTFNTSSNQNWERINMTTIHNQYKNYFKTVSNDKKQMINDSIQIYFMKGEFEKRQNFQIKGKLLKVNDIKILKKRNDEKATINILKNIKVLQYDNRTYQIILLKELIFLLEDFSHENELISVICDEVNNFLYLCFEGGIVEMFRIELKGISTILNKQQELIHKIDSDINFNLGIKNAIKNLFQPLKSINIDFYNQALLRPLLKNYYNTYNDFNNINWFSQSDVIKKSSSNDIILFHFKYQLNYFNMCFNDLHKYQNNSYSFIQPAIQVFDKIQTPVEPQININSMEQYFVQQQDTEFKYNKKNLFHLDLQHFHSFLNNLSLDRFQFLREKFNIIPIYFFLLDNKLEVDNILNKKEIKQKCDEYFMEIYQAFLKDSLEEILLEQDENEISYLRFNMMKENVTAIHYNPQQFFTSDSNWKTEYLSSFFEYILQDETMCNETLLMFIKNFRIKMPLIKTRMSIQGVGNTMTHFLPEVDSDYFKNNIIYSNSHVNIVIMCSLLSFLLTYRYIPQEFSKAVAQKVFQYFTKSSIKINVFNLMLYFFNDNIFISASTHFLLNQLTNETLSGIQNFEVSPHTIQKFMEIFKNQVKKINNPKDEFSNLELCCLLVIILVQPKDKWAQSETITNYIVHVVNSASLQNCMQNCFFSISILKFLIKTLSRIYSQISKKVIQLLIKNLHYICLYYGLSLDREQEYLTILHKGLYENKLRQNSHMYILLQDISFQPFEIRLNIRKKANKLIKNLAEEDLNLVLSVFHQLLDDYEHFYFTHISIIDLLKFLIRFDDNKLKNKLDLIVQLILKSLDPHKPELRPKCQEYATKTLKSILKRYSFSDFNQKTQHFAVSNKKNNIIIYDLKMALEWKVLKGHSQSIDCLIFHPNGKIIASFSYAERKIILWEIQQQGFFASILNKGNMIIYQADLSDEINQYMNQLQLVNEMKWSLKFGEKQQLILQEKNSNFNAQLQPKY